MSGEAPRASATSIGAAGVDEALGLIRLLADEVGPRRPTSPAERVGAQLVRDWLSARGVAAGFEPFAGYSTFAAPYAVIGALAVVPALMPRSWRIPRGVTAAGAAAGLIAEGGLRWTPLSGLLSRRPSRNVVATIEPAGEARRTLCLVSHLDTSRSGLMFHPALVGHLNAWIAAQSVAVLVQAGEPVLVRSRPGRLLLAAARTKVAAGLILAAEREARGRDVPGANDNASGVAVTCRLAAELTDHRLEHTRVVLLATGCEESGLLGMQAFLRGRDIRGWLFLNFDSVGGPATLRYIEQEGIGRKWPADFELLRIAVATASEHPELGLEPAGGPIGLTYDTTAVLARGGRALTFVAGDHGVIPNYHWPTDTSDNVDRTNLAKALETGRAMLAAIDAGAAD